MANEIKPGTGGRPWGCFYFKEDYERAAAHVREKAPQVFEWIKAHPEGWPNDMPMHQLFWRTAMEVLSKASLVDLGKVALILRNQATPLSEEQKRRLERINQSMRERAEARKRKELDKRRS